MKTILITGGAGYVGAVLVPKLLKKGYVVCVLDLFTYGNTLKKHKNLTNIKGDIRDKKIVKEALGGLEGKDGIDAVVHLACISNDPSFELDPKLGKSINYDATIQLIDMAKEGGIKRFIYASSSSVYGIKKVKNVTEDLPLKPLTDYSKYKALCEKYLLKKGDKNFTAVILRPATVCGWSPRLRLDLTVNILTLSALVNNKIIVNGGSQKRPNIHIQDMVDTYIKMLEYPKEKVDREIFNVGYENYTLLEIANMVKKVIGDKKITIEIKPTNDLRSYHISSEKIKRVLGFVPKHTVEEAISDLVKAFQKGKIPNAFTSPRYFNIQMLKSITAS